MPIMLSSTSLFSSSGPTAPPAAPLQPPWLLALQESLPFLAADQWLALDYTNLNALFIHPRINSHSSEPVKGSVRAADQSLGQGGAEWLPLCPGVPASLPIREPREWGSAPCGVGGGGQTGGSARRVPSRAGGSEGSGLPSGSAHCAGRACPASGRQRKAAGNPRRCPVLLSCQANPFPSSALGREGRPHPSKANCSA